MSLAEELLADLEDGDDGEADDMLEAAYASRNVNPVTGQVGDDGGLTAMETDDDNRLNAALHGKILRNRIRLNICQHCF